MEKAQQNSHAQGVQVVAHGGMGNARVYQVERYYRECLVPGIVSVSRVAISTRTTVDHKS